MEMKEDDTIMMFFAGRLMEVITSFFVNNPEELLTNEDFLSIKKRVWNETKMVFDITGEVEDIYEGK